jgi:predicted GIY-YIG superfamily endonuclease/ribosomal protein S18 acetylase RimI-like enzyme
MAFLYILHLNEKLAHTQHYAGSTKNLQARLEAHAMGRGARYTEVLKERAIDWKLAGLYQCNHAVMRRLERMLKDTCRIFRYCEVCSEAPATLPGTQRYPLEQVKFPIDSQSIRAKLTARPVITCRIAQPSEANTLTPWMIGVMKVERDALGFIPGGSGRGVEDLVKLGRIMLAEVNGRPCGYIAHFGSKDHARVTIHQCCVDDSFRFMGVGRMMIEGIRKLHPTKELVAKVRFNLAANHFWTRIGFVIAASLPHETSGNIIHHYYLSPETELR